MVHATLNFLFWLFQYTPIMASFAATAGAGYLVIRFNNQIGTAIKDIFTAIGTAIVSIWNTAKTNYDNTINFIRKYVITRAAFFRLAIVSCMSMSVIHGSHLFFNQENIDILNYALAATFDVGVWVLIEGMIITRKKGYILASIAILAAIIVVSGISFSANLVYNRHFYDPSGFSGVFSDTHSDTAKNYITMLQSTPPLLIILMSVVAELFTKTDVTEEVSYAERLAKKYERKKQRLEARLKSKHDEEAIKQKYAVVAVNDQKQLPVKQTKQQVKWSILGIVKGYEVGTQQDIIQLTETIQKISIAVTHLQTTVTNNIQLPPVNTQPNFTIIEDKTAQQQQQLNQGYTPPQINGPTIEDTTIMHMHNTADATYQDSSIVSSHPISNNSSTPETSPHIQLDAITMSILTRYPKASEWISKPMVSLSILADTVGMPIADVKKYAGKKNGFEVQSFNADNAKVPSVIVWIRKTQLTKVQA